jgi:sec-independent protein translocase protein TatC
MALFKNQKNPEAEMSFLEHLEALRWHLVRSAIVVLLLAIGFFVYREFLFDSVLLAPKMPDFWTYRQFCKLSHFLNLGDALCFGQNTFELINTELSGQFTMHMWASIVAGLVCGAPYVFWELWQFIRPALKSNEKNAASGTVFYTTVLFLLGVLFGYYIIVPLSVNFLGTYQVSAEVKNMIQMDSFISTVTTITLASGIVFELPVVVYLLTKIGLMGPAFMRTYRRHAVVVILILAAIITPSPDVTSQLLVALPLYLLYEISIFISAYVQRKEEKQ